MSDDVAVRPVSRRALVAGSLGAIGGAVVAGLARPLPAEATTNHVHYVNDENGETVLFVESRAQAGFPNSGTGLAVYGETVSGVAVFGSSYSGPGVEGISVTSDGVGVGGRSEDGPGVHGLSASDAGVRGDSRGKTPGIVGQSYGGVTGVYGFSGSGPSPLAPGRTGVFGRADQGVTSVGVKGSSGSGTGVFGQSPKGRGGQFSGGLAQLRLVPSPHSTHPATGAPGDLFVDSSGDLWYCKGGAVWVQLA